MTPLPGPPELASLVSNVTKTMLGIAFEPDTAAESAPSGKWRTAVLPIPGERPVTVGLSSSLEGSLKLGAAMFRCPPEAVDASMADDSLRELVNMTAGLVKSSLALPQLLGLPRVFEDGATGSRPQAHNSQTVVLKAPGLGLVLWVQEGLL
jgi:hypothetical protein